MVGAAAGKPFVAIAWHAGHTGSQRLSRNRPFLHGHRSLRLLAHVGGLRGQVARGGRRRGYKDLGGLVDRLVFEDLVALPTALRARPECCPTVSAPAGPAGGAQQ